MTHELTQSRYARMPLKYGDGVTAGRHKVLIQAFDSETNVRRAIPRRYANAAMTPLEVHTDDSPFHFKIAK